jgi:hypothetical protein
MAQLEATVTHLTGLYAQENQQYADADSIGDNEEAFNEASQGRGRGFANRGRGFHLVGVLRPRQGAPQEDDVFGRPKFTILKFLGKDAEDYLNWEMRIESLWRLHECTDDRKIPLAVSEFDEYVMSWWDNAVSLSHDNKMLCHEMVLIMQHAWVHEPAEQTMQQFLSGLTYQIRRIVRHHLYKNMAQLLHQACEAKASLAEEAKFSRPTVTRSCFSSWPSSAGQPTISTRDTATVRSSMAPTTAKSGAPAVKSVA